MSIETPMTKIDTRTTSVNDENKYIRESKRLKILVTKERCIDTYGEIRDGCVDDVTSTLNSNLVLHKDTKLLSQKDFSPLNKHVLPVIPFTVAHSRDERYIRNTAKIIARMMEKLRRCMSFVLDEIRIDADYWGDTIFNEMEKVLKSEEFVQLTKDVLNYDGDTAIQAFNCKYLVSNFNISNGIVGDLLYKCTQGNIESVYFLPKLDERNFKFRVSFDNDSVWELEIEN